MVEKIDAIIEKSTPTLRQLYYTNEALRGAIEFGSTYLIMDNIKKALEEKNDSLLQASKKQLENAYDGIHNKDYDHEVDRAVAKAILPALAKALNADELPSFYQTINGEFKGDYNAYVDNIYDSSILSNRKNLDKFLAKPSRKTLLRLTRAPRTKSCRNSESNTWNWKAEWNCSTRPTSVAWVK